MSVFSDLLSDYINEKQIKILSLAKYCDIDRSTMYKVMNGKRNPPSQETLKKMAHFMHQHLWNIRSFRKLGRLPE